MSVFMYGHNGRHFGLAALQKRPAARLAALQKCRFKDHRGDSREPRDHTPLSITTTQDHRLHRVQTADTRVLSPHTRQSPQR